MSDRILSFIVLPRHVLVYSMLEEAGDSYCVARAHPHEFVAYVLGDVQYTDSQAEAWYQGPKVPVMLAGPSAGRAMPGFLRSFEARSAGVISICPLPRDQRALERLWKPSFCRMLCEGPAPRVIGQVRGYETLNVQIAPERAPIRFREPPKSDRARR